MLARDNHNNEKLKTGWNSKGPQILTNVGEGGGARLFAFGGYQSWVAEPPAQNFSITSGQRAGMSGRQSSHLRELAGIEAFAVWSHRPPSQKQDHTLRICRTNANTKLSIISKSLKHQAKTNEQPN